MKHTSQRPAAARFHSHRVKSRSQDRPGDSQPIPRAAQSLPTPPQHASALRADHAALVRSGVTDTYRKLPRVTPHRRNRLPQPLLSKLSGRLIVTNRGGRLPLHPSPKPRTSARPVDGPKRTSGVVKSRANVGQTGSAAVRRSGSADRRSTSRKTRGPRQHLRWWSG